MGSFRFRKQFKIAPGVKVTLNKQSISGTLGVRGANYTLNTKGQQTTSVGIPGSGLWYRDTRKVTGVKKSSAKKPPTAAPTFWSGYWPWMIGGAVFAIMFIVIANAVTP
jgi:hypothetical protein